MSIKNAKKKSAKKAKRNAKRQKKKKKKTKEKRTEKCKEKQKRTGYCISLSLSHLWQMGLACSLVLLRETHLKPSFPKTCATQICYFVIKRARLVCPSLLWGSF